MEFGLHESFPIYAGGLGVLAGDFVKAAHDLALPVVGVGLRWERGYGLQYHADQDTEELRRFWGRTLDIDGSTIHLVRKSNSGQLAGRRWRSRHGVLTVRVHDTLLRARLQAWIDSLQDQWLISAKSGV